MSDRISAEQIRQYQEHGFLVLGQFLTKKELSAAREGMLSYFPTAEEFEDKPERYGFIHEDPEHLQIEFPYSCDVLNDLATHPEIVKFAQKVLGTRQALLTQSALWAKYAGTGDFEQSLHLDYQGNTLVVPRDDGSYRQINIIIYYTDVSADLGPTHVISQTQTRHIPLWPTHRMRRENPDLYKLEKPVLVKAGGMLIFSMRTWHRASAMLAESGVRFTQHLIYRAAEHHFQGFNLWSAHGEEQNLQDFVTRASPQQRQALGFPSMDDPYWTDETRQAVRLRYPGIRL